MQMIFARVPVSLRKALDTRAAALDRSTSWVVRQALLAYMGKERRDDSA